MRYNTLLFDLDGTINDNGEGITKCVAYALEKMGRCVPEQAILERFVGPPLIAAFEMYAGMTEEAAIRATNLYRERYTPIGWRENRVYEGVAPLLRALKRQGAYIAIASGKPEIFVRQIAEHFGFDRYFDALVGITMESKTADKCALIQRALPDAYDPDTTVMIGDRLFDIEAGRKMGLHTIGAGYGFGTREELENAGAEHIAMTVSELTDMLIEPTERERGRFITYEGADGCGKSTQMRLSAEYLRARGYDVVPTREPGGSPIAERIRNVVLGIENKGMTDECEALLFAAARVEHVRSVILPAISEGKIVLCDRFLDSSIAYQARGRELGDDFIRQINRFAMEAVPDRTLLFVGDQAEISQRLRRNTQELDRIEIEKEAFVNRVYAGFEDIRTAEPQRVHRIESTRSIEEIFADVRAELDDVLSH